MSMYSYHNLKCLFILGGLLLGSLQASAHALKETSARIILREGQVEVRITTDISRWQMSLQDSKAWLLGDIDQVMPQNLNPKQKADFFKKVLKSKTTISINNQVIALNVLSFSKQRHPKHSEQSHGNYPDTEGNVEIILAGQHTNTVVDQLNIQFPKSLGTVHAGFVKPQYKMIKPGNSTQVSFAAPTPNADTD